MKLDLGFLGIPTYKVHKILRNSQKFLAIPKNFWNSQEFLGFLGVYRFYIMSSINIQCIKYMQI